MVRYFVSRVGQAVVSVLFITTAVFALVRLTGDPIDTLVPDNAPTEMQEKVRSDLGLDKPIHEQYLTYLTHLVRLDLGVSFITAQPVTEVLARSLPATASLALASAIFAVVVAVPLGIVSALRRGTIVDRLARAIAVLGQSAPSFWLAMVLIVFFAVALRWLPVAGLSGPSSYILPAIAMGLAPIAGIVRLTRSSMLDVLGSDYVLMARAKGLPPRTVVVKHALRNAAIPVITYAGLVVAAFMNGSVVIENVFAWPGIGTATLRAVTFRDFPVVQGAVIFVAVVYITVNLLVDALYAVLDPRIRYR